MNMQIMKLLFASWTVYSVKAGSSGDAQFLQAAPTTIVSAETAACEWNGECMLSIPSRRQWDCNYEGNKCSPMRRSVSGRSEELDGGSLRIEFYNASAWCDCGDEQCSRGLCNCHDDPQFHLCDGYCGATAAQEAWLWFGAYITVGVTRSLLHAKNLRELGPCINFPEDQPGRDLNEIIKFLGFRTEVLCAGTSTRNLISFTLQHLKDGIPVIVGLWVRGSAGFSNGRFEHLVLVVGRTGDSLLVNDGYRPTPQPVALQHKSKRACDLHHHYHDYCVPANNDGQVIPSAVAVLPPSGLCPARLRITGCADRSASACPDREEPNWSIQGVVPVAYSLSVEPAKPACELKSDKRYIVVKTEVVTGTGQDPSAPLRDVIKAFGSPFKAPATQCFNWIPGSESLSIGAVNSRDAVFAHFVEESSQAHSDAHCPA